VKRKGKGKGKGDGMRAFDDYDTPLDEQDSQILRRSERNRADGMQDNMI